MTLAQAAIALAGSFSTYVSDAFETATPKATGIDPVIKYWPMLP